MPERRLVRITTDLLLPADFDYADLADVHVAAVVVEGAADMSLTNVIDYTVREARVEVIPGGPSDG